MEAPGTLRGHLVLLHGRQLCAQVVGLAVLQRHQVQEGSAQLKVLLLRAEARLEVLRCPRDCADHFEAGWDVHLDLVWCRGVLYAWPLGSRGGGRSCPSICHGGQAVVGPHAQGRAARCAGVRDAYMVADLAWLGVGPIVLPRVRMCERLGSCVHAPADSCPSARAQLQ